MKVIFFGLGSIGRRHAEILQDAGKYELFAYRSGEGSGDNSLNIKEVHTWKEVEEIAPDAAFITNPTFLHIDTATRCAAMGMKLFIEKPIGASIQGLDALLKEVEMRKLPTYVAYNLRFHPVIERLKEYLSSKEVYHASVYTSDFLPGWRPDQCHLDYYFASKGKGGGVVLDQSHDLDYIGYLFGDIEDIDGTFGRVSDVTVDAEDFLDAIIRTKTTCVNLHLNFLSRHTEQTIRIDCPGEYIYADIWNNRIEFHGEDGITVEEFGSDAKEVYAQGTTRRQLEYFFNNIGNEKMMNNLPEASMLFKKIIEFKERKG